MSLPKQQKAVVVEKYGSGLTLKEVPVPQAGPGQVLVKVEASVMGSGLKSRFEAPRNPFFSIPEPFVAGTAGVGRVVESDTFKKGQLVYLDPTVWSRDGPEHYLVKSVGDGATPESKALSAEEYKRNGYWLQYALVDIESCYPVNEDAISFDTDLIAGLSFPLVAYGGFREIGLQPGETVAIGPSTGRFSSGAVSVAASMGAKVLALGRDRATLEKLASHYSNVQPVLLTGDSGADAATLQKLGPLDAYMDYTPNGAAGPVYLDAAIGALRFGGRVILSGFVFANLSIPYGLVVAKDLTIKGKLMYSRQEAKDFLKMVENGIFKMDHVSARKFPIDKYAEAAELANGKAPWDELVVVNNNK